MTVAIVGLGLIGGSFAKALREKTGHVIFGMETNVETAQKALREQVIDRLITPEELGEAELTITALYPEETIAFLLKNLPCFRKNSVVIDTCGIKEKVVSALDRPFYESGVRYVGTHPMAGREFSGYDHSLAALFENASFIITETKHTNSGAVQMLSELALQLGFDRVIKTTPKEHDRVIAYTSQLAHVVSNAYIKSPTLQSESGFSAGSFKDLTRVAKCNPDMWTALFLDNREALLKEIDTLQASLAEYRNALETSDSVRLHTLLQEGSDLKEWSLKHST